MKSYRQILSGTDLRSIGNANEIVACITTQQHFDELFGLLNDADRIIVMRAADAIEKITARTPAYLQPHAKELLNMLPDAVNIESKWHLALLVSRLALKGKDLKDTMQQLSVWAKDKKESKIVRVNAIQGLFNLAASKPGLTESVLALMAEIEQENIPSLNARIRKLMAKR